MGWLHARLVIQGRAGSCRPQPRSGTAWSSACPASVVATACGTAAALALHRHKFRGSAVVDAGILLPTVVPEIVLAASLLLPVRHAGCATGFHDGHPGARRIHGLVRIRRRQSPHCRIRSHARRSRDGSRGGTDPDVSAGDPSGHCTSRAGGRSAPPLPCPSTTTS